LLASPPSYTAVIWPAAGFALGALLTHGRGLWPGIFLGSLVLNVMTGGAYSADAGWASDKVLVAAATAGGVAAQALVSRWLVARFVGTPINLRRLRDILIVLALAGPTGCLIAATIGVASLYLGGGASLQGLGHRWWIWWSGDVLGVAVFLPLMLVLPGAKNRMVWRGSPLGALPIAAVLVLMLPFGLTFYAWNTSSQLIYERNKTIFEALALESEQALLHRLASYNQGLLGTVGFIKGSANVTAKDWRTYVDALDVTRNYPALRGIGLIKNVEPQDLEAFVAQNRKDRPNFSVHPDTPGRPNLVVDFFEPNSKPDSGLAVGLNIAFEANRLEAALEARDSGQPAITKRISLVQDETMSGAFLLLHPMYRTGMPTGAVEQRRTALIGWIYAPFVIQNFMGGLTSAQGRSLDLQINERDLPDADDAIFDSKNAGAREPSVFAVSKRVEVMQQPWILTWRSTPEFDGSVQTGEPIVVLAAGLIVTGLFGALLFLFAHRAETVKALVELTTHELTEREALYRLLGENTSDMISRVALDGTRLYTSPACMKLLGYRPDELQAMSAMSVVRPDQRALIETERARLASGAIDECSGVFALRRKDGGWIQADVVWKLIRDPATGKAMELLVTERDVTLREQRAAELELAREAAEVAMAVAEKANEAKTAFLATMSHEIRTPLNGVIGYTDLLLHSGELSETSRRHAERIGTSGAALLTVVNDILDFSRIEAGRVELDIHPFSLVALVEEAMSIVRGAATRKGLHIAAEVEAGLPGRILGDENRLRQILLNLLNNGVKFTARGRVLLSVKQVGDLSDEARFRFVVHDTGIGIPPDQQDRLFERFSQVDGTVRREFGGSGLGLAISKRLVEIMGGSIGVDSAAGAGSTFWFEVVLPKTDEVAAAPRRAAVAVERRPARILLVEDMEINRDIACAVLSAAGHQVDLAIDGAEAVAAVQAKDYDVVLMDVQMPGMDGLTATRRIRQLATPTRNVPIIALTADVLSFQIAELHEAGVTDHVGKPFQRDDLLGAVDRAVEDYRDERFVRSPSTGPEETFNRLAYIDLEAAIGSPGVRRLLGKLSAALQARLMGGWVGSDERDLLRRDAHMLIPSTAMIGFKTLSSICGELETACDGSGDLTELMTRYAKVREEALDMIETLKTAA
jgi:PAS domain S-box-containing protein